MSNQEQVYNSLGCKNRAHVPRRVSKVIYENVRKQQFMMDKMQNGAFSNENILNMIVSDQNRRQSLPSSIQAGVPGNEPTAKQSTQVISKPTELLPWTARFDRLGFSAEVIVLPKGKGKSYQAAVHISFLKKMCTIQVQMSRPDFSFNRMLHVRNITPNDSAMTVACRTGDFESVRKLLGSGAAHGSDVTSAGWPMLDVSTKFFYQTNKY